MTSLRDNITFEKCGFTLDQIAFSWNFSWWIGGAASAFISSAGIILNSTAICILCKRSVSLSLFNQLLISLAVMDNLFLSTTIFDAMKDQLLNQPLPFYLAYIFVNIMYPIRSIAMGSSIYMTVSLSLEMYTSLAKPFDHRARHSRKNCTRLLLYIISSLTFSFLYSIPRFLDLEIKENSSCDFLSQHNESLHKNELQNRTIAFYICPTELRQNPFYILWYINVSNLVVTGFVPCILLVFFNYKIYNIVQNNRTRRASMIPRCGTENREHNCIRKDIRHAFILFSIVTLLVFCHSLRVALNIEEVTNLSSEMDGRSYQCPLRYWAVIAIPISSILIQINAGANFFIYFQFDKTFREYLLSIVSRNSSTRQYQDNLELQEIQ